MNKSGAIWKKCQDCGGRSPKEVTLCHIADCSLWPYRFGYSFKDKRFLERMTIACQNYPNEYEEFIQILSDYVKSTLNSPKTTQIDAVLESNLDAIRKTLTHYELFKKK